jgi:hypothetical protein
VVNGWASAEEALDIGADFALSKPIQKTRLRRVLDIALPKMEREHRRYFRYDADLPLRFRNHLGQSFTTRMQNVSEGGFPIVQADNLLDVDRVIRPLCDQTHQMFGRDTLQTLVNYVN